MRTKEGQTRHDSEVFRIGNEALGRGWKTVFVDLPGYSKPPIINGHIPDVYGTDGYSELVAEVETEDTKISHEVVQHSAFRRWQNEYPANRKFQVFIV